VRLEADAAAVSSWTDPEVLASTEADAWAAVEIPVGVAAAGPAAVQAIAGIVACEEASTNAGKLQRRSINLTAAARHQMVSLRMRLFFDYSANRRKVV